MGNSEYIHTICNINIIILVMNPFQLLRWLIVAYLRENMIVRISSNLFQSLLEIVENGQSDFYRGWSHHHSFVWQSQKIPNKHCYGTSVLQICDGGGKGKGGNLAPNCAVRRQKNTTQHNLSFIVSTFFSQTDYI